MSFEMRYVIGCHHNKGAANKGMSRKREHFAFYKENFVCYSSEFACERVSALLLQKSFRSNRSQIVTLLSPMALLKM
jgi:hypothetical protein